ncbi:hypothetical protein [Pseudarthrobacter raffinosi]|uniref:hypothetical protein n=1 Tax=Pseudarthrobacter raffinosi TaxID=2953651 RepID=UPI00208EAF31|nr:hypothetical protein [Pseudarthrobacter sp. MDT3-9]MCO4251252.1 hypothetical protein [Pseudarthrobacter sp. MDT3-9]
MEATAAAAVEASQDMNFGTGLLALAANDLLDMAPLPFGSDMNAHLFNAGTSVISSQTAGAGA